MALFAAARVGARSTSASARVGAAAVTLRGAEDVKMYLEVLKEMVERGAKAARVSTVLH